MSRQNMSWRHLSISGISQLLLTWFWWNFKGRFLEPFFNRCQPLWWYLSSQHLSWQHLCISGISQLLLSQFWLNFKCRSQFLLLKFYQKLYPKFFGPKIFFDPNFFSNLNFLDKIFMDHNFFGPNSFWPKFFLPKLFLDMDFFKPHLSDITTTQLTHLKSDCMIMYDIVNCVMAGVMLKVI